MVKNPKEQLSEDEMKIIAELKKNAKENIATIASNCGFSRQKAWRLIKQLGENHLIWGYTAIFDERKMGKSHFVYMAKRTSKPVTDDIRNEIISREFEKSMKSLGIELESSFYVHGEYDWVMTFTADDIKHAKKLADKFYEIHPGFIEKASLLQTIMFIKKQYILNPEKSKLKEYL